MKLIRGKLVETFFIQPNKRVGWNRNVGQEIPNVGFVDSGAGRGAGVREQVQINNGPQTPAPSQPAIDLWIPLLFWFNQDPRLSIPSVSIPYGQRFIDVTLANANQILQHVGYTPFDDNPGGNPPPVPNVQVCELYINNIFVNPEIHDIFIKRIGFSLIRVHRQQSTRTNKSADRILHQQLKWPIETLYMGLRPVDNINVNSTKLLDSWYVYARTQENDFITCSLANTFNAVQPANMLVPTLSSGTFTSVARGPITFPAFPTPGYLAATGPGGVVTVDDINKALAFQGVDTLYDPGAFANPLIPTPAELVSNLPSVYCHASYQTCHPTINVLTIEAHGIPLYRDIPSAFFNQYVPFTYGGQHINTPVDCGALMVTFNLYPGSYQPSGHVNVSRAREFYIDFVRNQINGVDDTSNADLVVVAIAINFLLISDGSAVNFWQLKVHAKTCASKIISLLLDMTLQRSQIAGTPLELTLRPILGNQSMEPQGNLVEGFSVKY